MRRFWVLLGFASVDLVVAAIFAARGDRNAGFAFLALAAVLAFAALLSGPKAKYDARGKLLAAEGPHAAILGAVGAVGILAAAVSVFVLTTDSPTAVPVVPVSAAQPRPVSAPRRAPKPAHRIEPGVGCMIGGNGQCRCFDGRGRKVEAADKSCREFATRTSG